jgi:putative addiction module killer protein
VFRILRYVNAAGTDVFGEWLNRLSDVKARAKVAARVARLEAGNFGDCKPLRGGVWELRVDHGPGYRVYCARAGRDIVLLLCGGDKRQQSAQIDRAVAFWDDYKRRTAKR